MERILIKSSPVSSPCPPRLLCSSSSVTHNCSSNSLKIPRLRSSLNSDYHVFRIFLQKSKREPRRGSSGALTVQSSLCIGKSQRWWEKGVKPNMKEITSTQDLVDSLSNSGDKLVVVDFFSPGCGGCKALHPKICQFAEMNPDVQFLQVNYEEHKSMCYSLNVHVLPFFRFYRGAHGRLCSFSCTNATIKKFKDAIAKHSPERCSLGPPKGLEESELHALAANKDLSFNYTPKPTVQPMVPKEAEVAEPVPSKLNLPIPSSTKPIKNYEENNTLVSTS